MRKIVFSICLIVSSSVFADDSDFHSMDEYDNYLIFNELISNPLKKLGVDAHVCFSGKLHTAAVFASQNLSDGKESAAMQKSDINFKFLGRAESFSYGFEIDVKGNSGVIKNGSAIVDTAYAFLELPILGKISLGFLDGAADSFAIDGGSYLLGFEGPGSGDLDAFFNASVGSLICTGALADDSKAAKITWSSNLYKGFRVGASFTPNNRYRNLFRTTKCNHLSSSDTYDLYHSNCAYSKNLMSLALSYEYGSEESFFAKAVFSYWNGTAEVYAISELHNPQSYNIGLLLQYKNLKFVAAFTDNKLSFLNKARATENKHIKFEENINYNFSNNAVGLLDGADAGKIYSFGIVYKLNKDISVSAGYLKSNTHYSRNDKATGEVMSLACEYNVFKNFFMYCEYDHIKTTTCDRARVYANASKVDNVGNNSGSLVFIGAKFLF